MAPDNKLIRRQPPLECAGIEIRTVRWNDFEPRTFCNDAIDWVGDVILTCLLARRVRTDSRERSWIENVFADIDEITR